MENRTAGYMIIAIAALIAFIVYSFNMVLIDIIGTSCSHGPECPMWGTLNVQTNVSIGIIFFIMLIGVYLAVFSKEKPAVNRIMRPRIKLSEINRDNYDDVIRKLDDNEKPVFESVIDEKGSIFQSAIVEKTGMSKVKVTRILDRLEGKGLIERKRRGMTNMVVIKH